MVFCKDAVGGYQDKGMIAHDKGYHQFLISN